MRTQLLYTILGTLLILHLMYTHLKQMSLSHKTTHLEIRRAEHITTTPLLTPPTPQPVPAKLSEGLPVLPEPSTPTSSRAISVLPLKSQVLCAVMREPSVRPFDITHPDCHFFDISGGAATWWGNTVQLPCQTYTSDCYTKKLAVLFRLLLKSNYTTFYYVEGDHEKCVSHRTIENLAESYMHSKQSPQLITTGYGASGWLCSRSWAAKFVSELETCTKWCYCPDCIAAFLKLPRATTRVVLTQHSIENKVGLNKNDKLLPRCFQKRTEYGLNYFDYFDHAACHLRDISPCAQNEMGLFVGH